MYEHEPVKENFFKGRTAIEFSPRDVELWNGDKPVDLTDCDRIIIEGDTIEFQRDKEFHILCLDEEPISISSSYIPSIYRTNK